MTSKKIKEQLKDNPLFNNLYRWKGMETFLFSLVIFLALFVGFSTYTDILSGMYSNVTVVLFFSLLGLTFLWLTMRNKRASLETSLISLQSIKLDVLLEMLEALAGVKK